MVTSSVASLQNPVSYRLSLGEESCTTTSNKSRIMLVVGTNEVFEESQGALRKHVLFLCGMSFELFCTKVE